MKYKVTYDGEALRQLRKMDSNTSSRIISWVDKNLQGCDNPRKTGKALSGKHAGKWRYRVGDYRIIAKIEDGKLRILIVELGHRKNIYG